MYLWHTLCWLVFLLAWVWIGLAIAKIQRVIWRRLTLTEAWKGRGRIAVIVSFLCFPLSTVLRGVVPPADYNGESLERDAYIVGHVVLWPLMLIIRSIMICIALGVLLAVRYKVALAWIGGALWRLTAWPLDLDLSSTVERLGTPAPPAKALPEPEKPAEPKPSTKPERLRVLIERRDEVDKEIIALESEIASEDGAKVYHLPPQAARGNGIM